MDQGSAGYFWILFGILTCVNLPFIVVDLVYAASGNPCTTLPVPNISFTLRTWLEVDGGLRLAFVGLFLLVAIIACCSIDCALKIFVCTLILLIVYSLFNLSWLIVGAVMFWGYLNDQPGCNSTDVAGYMFAVLILGFLGVCGNCFFSYKNKQQ